MRMPKLAPIVALFVFAAMFGFAFAPRAAAQDATPAAGECAVTTPEENIAIVTRFLEASQAVDDDAEGSAAIMDELLAEDVTYDNVPGANNVPGNDDEIQFFLGNAAMFTDFSFTIVNTFANEDMVAVHFTFHVNAHAIPGAAPDATADADGVLIVRIECGKIAEFTQIIDTMTLMSQLGLMPAATPTS